MFLNFHFPSSKDFYLNLAVDVNQDKTNSADLWRNMALSLVLTKHNLVERKYIRRENLAEKFGWYS